MKILVTGATGFLGTTLCKKLAQDGHSVTALGSAAADLRVQGSLDRFADEFDQIYHLAAWTQAGDFCLRHPGEQWVINQQMNTNVLDWWQRRQPQAKLVTVGTSCSYAPDLPMTEANYLQGEPIESLFAYAHTKRMLLVGQIALARQFGLKWVTLVPSTLYGPGYHTDGRQMHFIFDLIRKILGAAEGGEAATLWGDGFQKRELIYVGDFVASAIQLASRCENELINVGDGDEFTIRQFAEMICLEVCYDPAKIKYDVSRYVGAKSKRLAIEKLDGLLPGRSRTPLTEGLRRTIEWFRVAYPGPRN
jgi:GDP-L-fucose synthase